MSSNIGLVVNPKSGFVGIGTGRPSTLLHVDGNMLAAGTITASNLSILGDFVTLNTITSNTEQMVIQNAGTGPALKVTQTGAHPIADFYDDGQVLAMRIADGGNVGIGTLTPTSKLHVNGDVTITSTGALTIPRGTTAQRPTNPAAGMIRYNNTEGYIETYEAILTTWIPISSFLGVLATGGTETYILVNGLQYRVHTFTSVGTSSFQVLRGGQVDYLVVAGGGGGGRGEGMPGGDGAGGGGAGGLIQGQIMVNAQSYVVSVGIGGTGSTTINQTGVNGANSIFTSITAIGGGGGGSDANGGIGSTGGSGGSGGGAGSVYLTNTFGGIKTEGQGNNGGDSPSSFRSGGGGGGAGSVGQTISSSNGGSGGNGINSDISGASLSYSGGGGGGSVGSEGVGGVGGTGVGGTGGNKNTSGPSTGQTNRGSGGGGGSGYGNSQDANIYSIGASGGSGIVIIRYRSS